MGLLNALTGNVSDVSPEEAARDLAPMLADGETIETAFKAVRDMYVFTSRRLIVIDKQGLRGSKVEYLSVPYRSIGRFSTENAGSFDMDSELRIWVTGLAEPITIQLTRGSNLAGVQRTLANHVLR